jgi:hypothetical protein
MVVFFDGLGDEGGDSMICNECETVSYCTKHGCIPKQSAPVQEFVALDALVKEEMRYYHDGHYLDSSDAKYQLRSFAHRISKSVRASTPPAAQPAPVQKPLRGWWAHTNPETGLVDVVGYQLTQADKAHGWIEQEIYTTPPAAQRQWVGLTDEEMYLNCPNWLSQEQCKVWIQQIEAKLKEKNT